MLDHLTTILGAAIRFLTPPEAVTYVLGTDVLCEDVVGRRHSGPSGYRPVTVTPNVYPIFDATDLDLEPSVDELEYVLGGGGGGGHHHGGGWGWRGRGNYLYPNFYPYPYVDVEDEVLRIAALREIDDRLSAVERSKKESVVGAGPQPQRVRHFPGTDEDAFDYLDIERDFDESFDHAMMRRTGLMRGGQ